MLRFYLMLIPTILFTAILLIIHAQPYDDHELRQLLLPEGCPAPCFMGIRPGVTSMKEAVRLLRSNDWVRDLQPFNFCNASHCKVKAYEIIWSDKAPSWLSRLVPAEITAFDGVVVTGLNLITTNELQLYDTYLVGFDDIRIVLKSVRANRRSSIGDVFIDAVELMTYPEEFGFTSSSYGSICQHDLGDFLALPVSDITIGQLIYGTIYSDEDFESLSAVIQSKYCTGR